MEPTEGLAGADGPLSSDGSDGADVAGLRSLTFSDFRRDQEPHMLCNFLMELGACSTSIVDAERGTDREVAIFGEPSLTGGSAAKDDYHRQAWNRCHVSAHFPASTSIEWIMEIVQEAFPNMPRYDGVTRVEDRDWVLHVQQSWTPIVVPPFVLRFPWHTDDAVAEAVAGHRRRGDGGTGETAAAAAAAPPLLVELELQGGVAFGTGEHPTTQMCLEFVGGAVRPGMRLMDYGAGSGVLGMAACKLDPTVRAVGVDIDVDAVRIANANARINGVDMVSYLSDLVKTENDDESTSILLKAYGSKQGDITQVLPEELNGPIYDACVANILAGPLVTLAPTLAGLLRPGAPLGLSGIMTSQSRMILESVYGDYFDNLRVEKELENWVLITGVRKAH